MINIIYSILAVSIVLNTIEILAKLDKDNRLILKVKERGILACLVFFFSLLIGLKFGSNNYYIFYLYLEIYIIISGVIDYKTKNVYCILNYITMFVAVIMMIYQINLGKDISFALGSFIIYILISSFLKYIGCYAGGDNEIFIAIGYFIATLGAFEYLLLNMILSSIILIIINIKNFDLFKLEYKNSKKIAFAPAIAISTLILIIVF